MLFQPKIEYLGYIIESGKVYLSPNKLFWISQSQTQKTFRVFLGFPVSKIYRVSQLKQNLLVI